MKNKRKVIMVYAVIMLCMTVNVFAEDNELNQEYLVGSWSSYSAETGNTTELVFHFDGVFIYGSNTSRKDRKYYTGGDQTYDEMFNNWWTSGNYEIKENTISLYNNEASGNSQACKGKTWNWSVTIIDNSEMVLTIGKSTKRFKKN